MPLFRIFSVSLLLAGASLSPSFSNAVQLSGRVSDAVTSAGLVGATVQVSEVSIGSAFQTSTTTDGNGNYTVDVPQSDQASLTAIATGYVSREITINSLTINQTIDFPLALPASISGTLRAASSNAGLPGRQVSLLDASTKVTLSSAISGADGSYNFDQLASGQYAVCVIDASDIYLDVCYDGKFTGIDGSINFTALALAAGQTLGSIDLTLDEGATISGTLIDAYSNAPIANSGIDFALYSVQLKELADFIVYTNERGHFTLSGLAAGSYYLRAGVLFAYDANRAYTPRLYGGGECGPQGTPPQCPFAGAMPVAAGTSDIDFAIFPGYAVTGRVVNAQTNAGIPHVTVIGCDDPSGFDFLQQSATAVTDAQGNYVLTHLVGESTHISTIDAPGYINIAWPNTTIVPAGGCAQSVIRNSPALNFTLPDQIIPHVDFALHAASAISGKVVTSDASHNPVPSVVNIYTSDKYLIAEIKTAADGTYTSPGIVAGTYYVAAYLPSGADCTVYGDLACRQGWITSSILPDQLTGIIVDGTTNQGNIDLHLAQQEQIFRSGFE